MSVVVAYKILEGATVKQLEALVADAIKNGWQPVGGVAISGTTLYQVVVGY